MTLANSRKYRPNPLKYTRITQFPDSAASLTSSPLSSFVWRRGVAMCGSCVFSSCSLAGTCIVKICRAQLLHLIVAYDVIGPSVFDIVVDDKLPLMHCQRHAVLAEAAVTSVALQLCLMLFWMMNC